MQKDHKIVVERAILVEVADHMVEDKPVRVAVHIIVVGRLPIPNSSS